MKSVAYSSQGNHISAIRRYPGCPKRRRNGNPWLKEAEPPITMKIIITIISIINVSSSTVAESLSRTQQSLAVLSGANSASWEICVANFT